MKLIDKRQIDLGGEILTSFDLQPWIKGTATLNGTTDNTVVMADIVTELALEAGDVIKIAAGAYYKLYTVESITDNSSIIVNYEHAGNRGNGSLKLPDATGQATVTRIAKWFNAPLGLGQAWVDTRSIRSAGVVYQSLTGRTMQISVQVSHKSGNDSQIEILQGGLVVARNYDDGGSSNQSAAGISTAMEGDNDYVVNSDGNAPVLIWNEYR